MNALVQGSRERLGMKIIGGERMGPNVFRALRRGEILAMLVDVVGEDDGIRVDFLGAPALVSPAAARVALRTNAWVVPAIVLRGPDDDLVIRAKLDTSLRDCGRTGDESVDARALTQRIMGAVEAEIVRHPDQWFIFRHMWKES
jgi:KDO2-lipid IV(A) lauroyltransferase